MAHQAHSIPWKLLTSHLRPVYRDGTLESESNIYTRQKPNQAKHFRYFVGAFARNLKEHTACERKKYAPKYEPPEKDEVILDDEICELIAPTIRRWRKTSQIYMKNIQLASPEDHLCNGKGSTHCKECQCAIPFEERMASAFLRGRQQNSCYMFFSVNSAAFFNVELVKTLLLYGKMEPILRMCSHPDVKFSDWEYQTTCYDEYCSLGWDMVYTWALRVYIGLNIFYCFPEIWSSEMDKNNGEDYRSTRCYQSMLRGATISGELSDIAHFPHREFFGIHEGQFKKVPRVTREKPFQSYRYRVPCGQIPFNTLLTLETHAPEFPTPSVDAVVQVHEMLRQKNLPNEMIHQIMDKASYAHHGKLAVPNDPLHPDNHALLIKHLTYCWQLLVRCSMMANAAGKPIQWEEKVAESLRWLIAAPRGKIFWDYKYLCEESIELYRFV